MKEFKNKKYIKIFMENYFKSLLEGYNNPANNETVKSVINDAIEEYAYSYQPGYTCYDMDMYVALYKYGKTPQQRKRALEHIQDIIDDDSYQYHDELIKNLREFTLIKDSLREEDEDSFDAICTKSLDFFKKELQWSLTQAKCGQADFIPDVPVWKASEELKEVAQIIVGTDMHNLQSYQSAREVLGA